MAAFGDGEVARSVKVWFTFYSSLTFCYFICGNIPKGFPRLLSILPIIYFFIILPLNLSSLLLGGAAGCSISWLASFKLVLLSFDKGPLSFDLPLHHFLAIGSLPIYIKESKPSSSSSPSGRVQGLYYYAFEVSVIGLILYTYWYFQQYDYKPNFIVMYFLYMFLMSFSLEVIIVFCSSLARLLFDLDVAPPFGNNYLVSTSLHDLWGRRWNLMSSSIFRSVVYEPVRRIFKKSWGIYVAILATFFVSGLMHELLFFYMGRKQPCWDVLCFFILHGICLAMEIKVKKLLNGKWQLNRLVSTPLVTGFLTGSYFWLIFPMFERLRVEIVVIEEIEKFIMLVKDVLVNTAALHTLGS
ncbi:hypothetical protein MKW94_025781 [Papaver nudicaule]|uniref:Wax synthase domain-containing protein n=1 Tax=Papaver nudicaule TaxID=74823 RepID=A0AA42AWY8_PAPNU|nr:hypothetical protein [Papaver nudicaule]